MEGIDLDENIWKEMGTLLSTRTGHRSIVLDNTIIHIGGLGTQ